METTSKRPQAKYAPGELQKTRQNLGQLELEEAAFMMKRLGGEIGIEKSEEITEDTLKKFVLRGNLFPPGKRQTVLRGQNPSSCAPIRAEVRMNKFLPERALPFCRRKNTVCPFLHRKTDSCLIKL